ncbi:MAG: ankyrin repeat domain-containing protein [Cytophagales bacterium]
MKKIIPRAVTLIFFSCLNVHASSLSCCFPSKKYDENLKYLENRDTPRSSLLHFYVYTGDIYWVNYLLSKGVDPNKKSPHGTIALHLCAKEGFVLLAELFLSYGADPFLRDFRGNTPMHYAAAFEHLKVIDLIGRETKILTLQRYKRHLTSLLADTSLIFPRDLEIYMFVFAGNPICEITNKVGYCCLDDVFFSKDHLFIDHAKDRITRIHTFQN